MKAALVFLFSLSSCFYHTEQQLPCHSSQLSSCVIPSGFNARGDPIPRNSISLNVACKVWMNSWKCVDDYISLCVSDMHEMVVGMALDEPRKFFTQMCNLTSQMRRDFLKHASCLADAVKLTLRKCTSNSKDIFHIVLGNNAVDQVNAGCCYFERFYDCLSENVEERCGNGTTETVKSYLKYFHVDILNSICKSHDAKKESCLDYLSRKQEATSERNAYIARLADLALKFLQ